jgi:hypothetical protein
MSQLQPQFFQSNDHAQPPPGSRYSPLHTRARPIDEIVCSRQKWSLPSCPILAPPPLPQAGVSKRRYQDSYTNPQTGAIVDRFVIAQRGTVPVTQVSPPRDERENLSALRRDGHQTYPAPPVNPRVRVHISAALHSCMPILYSGLLARPATASPACTVQLPAWWYS